MPSGWPILGVIVLVLLLSGCGVQQTKVYRVGVLSGLDFVADITDGLKAGMAELGYVEGEDITYDVQKTNFDMAAYRTILDKFVADKVDVIFVFPTEASQEAKTATEGTGIPVVFAFAQVEGMNLIDSVREPGGNITGVRYPGPDLALRRFEVMLELAPQANRVYIPYQRGYPIVDSQLEIVRPAAKAAGITLIEAPADNAAELEADLQARATAADAGLDAILLIAEPLGVTPDAFTVLAKFATEHKIPFGGALMTLGEHASVYGVNINNVGTGKQAAALVDKVLKGTRAGTIPVVSAENFLQINYAAAQKMGLTVPEGLLAQADEVIR